MNMGVLYVQVLDYAHLLYMNDVHCLHCFSPGLNRRFSVYNFKIGKQLADVSTRCFSHPQGKGGSEDDLKKLYTKNLPFHSADATERCHFISQKGLDSQTSYNLIYLHCTRIINPHCQKHH